ncbi:uncharacterized protein BDV14DRAFT_201041 [Aspergillus stella-maris]|uniref:uncharacterized protein n=1 Tax=Aspergillus stella-maris TaxID=1810926 RepID=UPI003CCCB0CC
MFDPQRFAIAPEFGNFLKQRKSVERFIAEKEFEGNDKTLGGSEVIIAVIQLGCYGLIQQMLEHCDGLDVNAESELDVEGENALHEALFYCDYRIAQLLITTTSIDVNKRDGIGYPPILATVEAGRIELVQTIIEGRDDLDVNAEHCGRTALGEALE